MTTIKVKVAQALACATVDGPLTSGMVGVPVVFEFGPEWNNLKKTAVFTAGAVARDRIDIGNTTTAPTEVLEKPREWLSIGVYGYTDDGTIVIPTVMAQVGVILPGADPSGDPGVDPELPIWAQLDSRVSYLEKNGTGGGGSDGEDGGYYAPSVTQTNDDTVQFDFAPSKPNMPAMKPTQVKLPAGPQGPAGDDYVLTDADKTEIAGMAAELVDAPESEGDYIPVPDTAEAGQTIVVKTVDENGKPTEWEAVDMMGVGYRLLVDFESTEELAANTGMVFDTTADGVPFDCSELLIRWVCPTGPGGYVTFAVNNQQPSGYYWNSAFSATGRQIAGTMQVKALGDVCLLSAITNATTNNDRALDVPLDKWIPGSFEKITSIKLTHFSGTYAAGLKIKIWGR